VTGRRPGPPKKTTERGKPRRRGSVFVGPHDGEDANGLQGIGGVVRAKADIGSVVIDLAEITLAAMLDFNKIMLAVRIVAGTPLMALAGAKYELTSRRQLENCPRRGAHCDGGARRRPSWARHEPREVPPRWQWREPWLKWRFAMGSAGWNYLTL
jgi:hypothetical protein